MTETAQQGDCVVLVHPDGKAALYRIMADGVRELVRDDFSSADEARRAARVHHLEKLGRQKAVVWIAEASTPGDMQPY